MADQVRRILLNEVARSRHGDGWLPLRRLAPSFAGLDDDAARVAYLESAAAAAWIGERSNREQRARLLTRLGEGVDADEALREVLGIDTNALDRAVRDQIRREFATEAATEALRRATAPPPAEAL